MRKGLPGVPTSGDPDLVGFFTRPRPSRQERFLSGRAMRKQLPRREHGAFQAAHDRPDPLEVIKRQNQDRIKKLVPVRNARMRASPFAFLRGSAAIMAGDLEATPNIGLQVAACGDMHVANFGLYGSAERNLIFAINDFDEVHPGFWEWDLKRLVASAAVAAEYLGGDRTHAAEAVRAASGAYRRQMWRYADMGFLETWYDQIDERAILKAAPDGLRDGVRHVMDKARSRGHLRTLDKLSEVVDGQHRIAEDVPLIVRETHQADGTPIQVALDMMLHSYLESLTDDRRLLLSRYRIVDVARKVVGVGSVGTACWVLMLQGLDADDPLFLQVKQAQASVLEPYMPNKLAFSSHGRRVVSGQRVIQGSPDVFLGWGGDARGDFYVRQLADMKGGFPLQEGDRASLAAFPAYCRLCGWALALAHAKSGDAPVIAGYCGKGEAMDEALENFSLQYALQNQRDHERFSAACGKRGFPCA